MNWPVFAFFFMFTYVAIGRLIKRHAAKKAKLPPKRTRLQRHNDELISVILPIVTNNK